MSDSQYSLALTITYIPYIVVEIPVSLVPMCVGPNILLPTLVILWGLTTTLKGLVDHYQSPLVARFFPRVIRGWDHARHEPVLQAGSNPNAHDTSIHCGFLGWCLLWLARIRQFWDGGTCRTEGLAVELHSSV